MEKKQNSVEWLFNQMGNVLAGYVTELTTQEILDQAKAMHQQEIEEAYDRKVIGDIQNWYIRNGKHYYELHYNKNTQDREIG